MGGKKARTSGRFAGNHQKSWLWGRHVIVEVLRAGHWPIRELLIGDHLDSRLHAECHDLATEREIPVTVADSDRIAQLCGHSDHQGLAARMGPFPVRTRDDLTEFLSNCSVLTTDRLPPLILICDRIQDAYNFGAILRNCDATAVDAVITGREEQASVTPHVARSSAGAVNYVTLFEVDNLVESVTCLQASGFHVLAASEKPIPASAELSPREPAALVLGSEAFGVAPEILDVCNGRLTIPMLGRVSSLNAAVASGVLLYELRRQQGVLPG